MKRLFDFTIALGLLLVLMPLMLLIAILIALRLGSPIFFTQNRPGLQGKPFKLIKFRTMSVQPENIPESSRLTPLGNRLREWSLDELPELWNVVKGDMSLVGPRPLLMDYLPLYTKEQNRRHDVKPGITGWAQIQGRNLIGWEEKFKFDVWYVENRSFWVDFKILVFTIKKVMRKEGITPKNATTVSRFTGKSP